MSVGPEVSRRDAMKRILLATTVMLYGRGSLVRLVAQTAPPAPSGYGVDPKLNATYKPGDFWPLTMTAAQRELTGILCDVILPADDASPSATQLQVPAFIDEWISAPYPPQKADRPVILDGLEWLQKESQSRYSATFADLTSEKRHAICDDICFLPKVKTELAAAAKFFARFRDLTLGGYYTTPEGLKSLGYIGNMPLPTFEGPPADLIAKLGLAD